MRRLPITVLVAVLTAALPMAVYAEPVMPTAEPVVSVPNLQADTGDTAWVLASSALVLAMVVPGLALFYGGLVRKKNVLGTMIYSFAVLCVVSLIWVIFGYSLAFSPDNGGVIGGLTWTMLDGVGGQPHAVYGSTVPHRRSWCFS